VVLGAVLGRGKGRFWGGGNTIKNDNGECWSVRQRIEKKEISLTHLRNLTFSESSY